MPLESRVGPAVDRTLSDDAVAGLSSIAPTSYGLADLDAVGERLRGRFVVQVNIDGGHWRTNVYRSAAAAERAVERAKDRGQRAHVTLVQMLPVGVVVGLGGRR